MLCEIHFNIIYLFFNGLSRHVDLSWIFTGDGKFRNLISCSVFLKFINILLKFLNLWELLVVTFVSKLSSCLRSFSSLVSNNDTQSHKTMASSSYFSVDLLLSFPSSSLSSVNLESNSWFITNVIEFIHWGQFFSEWGCWWKVQKLSIPTSVKFIDAGLCGGGWDWFLSSLFLY